MSEIPSKEIILRSKRWSAARKMEIVIRYLKGEAIDDLSREIGIAASQIEKWDLQSPKGNLSITEGSRRCSSAKES